MLKLCAKAGLVASGVVAIDGTKLSASAASDSNVDYDRIAREIIAEAIATDEAEDEQHGDARGDELPPELQTEAGRREWLARELARERRSEDQPTARRAAQRSSLRASRWTGLTLSGSSPGRRAGWGGCAKRAASRTGSGGRPPRRSHARGLSGLRLAALWLEDDLAAEERGNAAYEAFREHRRLHDPQRLGGTPKPYSPPEIPQGEVNVTDPDSRRMMGNRRYIQGYNAQAVVNEQQIVLAAEITADAGDFSHLRPDDHRGASELENAGIDDTPEVAVADAQYWNEQHMDDVTAEHGIQVLIPPDSGKRKGERPGWTGGRYSFMRRVLATDHGRETVPKTPEIDRAGVRSHQTQPQIHQLSPKRPTSGADRVAINHDESQPHQAPPPPNSHPEGLKRPPRRVTTPNPRHPAPTPGRRRPPARKCPWGVGVPEAHSTR